MRRRSLSLQLMAMQVAIVLITVFLAGALAVHLQRQQIRDAYTGRVMGVATRMATLPSVLDAYDDPDPSTSLQPLAELVREAAGVTFVVLTDARGVRYTHPDPERIGRPVSTDPSSTLAGEVFLGTEDGTLGESLRAKVPVRGAGGEVIGAASVGILTSSLAEDFDEDVPLLVAWLAAAAVVGGVGSALLTRTLRRRIYGLEPDEIARLLETREAMLHGIREGVIAIDGAGVVVLANDAAIRLLDLDDDPTGRQACAVLDPALHQLAQADRSVADEPVLSGERLLVANRSVATVSGHSVAVVLTLRDRTELTGALRELDSERSLTETLRAQAHEFSNHLHVLSGLIELRRHSDAVAFIDRIGGGGRLLPGALDRVQEPAVAALLLAKAAVARERGVVLRLCPDSRVVEGGAADGCTDLLTVLGNLVDNAVQAAGLGGQVAVEVRAEAGGAVQVCVDDDGPGVPEVDRRRVFEAGVSGRPAGTTHGHGIGLALVARITDRRGGTARIGTSPWGGARVEVRLPARARQVVP